ncbi:hypothetical protein EAI30_07240 [Romboutsia ilealis]|uniref:Alginate lyase family protein n=1 Tax=Romboutsia faecis TaxID=2764597 RepID=A0ABR7JKX7_9FIRM|nr:alginate lyase family protein [Romboutsia faecis]MBC5995348.1 alginate lyase family protein [Romboutsia faecis]MRN24407.1 hypothetical protein [Romboutsia ilealis]
MKEIFDIIDLNYKGLESVKKNYEEENIDLARKELINYFRNRKHIKGFIGDKEPLVDYIKLNKYEELKSILDMANNFANKKIIYDMKWDMERCKTPYIFEYDIIWDTIPFNDPEWTYMLNRHRYFITYGQSYLMTKDKKYIDAFNNQIKSWINTSNQTGTENKLIYRTIEAGLRCRNWIKALEYFIEDRNLKDSLIEEILITINDHMEFITKSTREDRLLSNWVILEQHGVFIASTYFPELKISNKLRENSLNIIESALEIQILDDGLQWEQSYMYHNEILNCMLDVAIIANKNNIKLSNYIIDKIKKMSYATLSFMKPNYNQSNYGDSDEEDLRDILGLASVVLNDGQLKYLVNELDLESIFNIGIEGIKIFEDLKPEEPKFKNIAHGSSGNYILRNKWGEGGTYTFFKCGPIGSGHGHFDLLHFDINYKGENYLVDSGRYNYEEGCEYRELLKRAISHNTTTVDDKEFTISRGSWGSSKVAYPIKRDYSFKKTASLVEGSHLGYFDLGVFTTRKLIYIEPSIWIVSDEFISQGTHKYKSYFNFEKDNLKILEDRAVYCGKNGKLNIVPISGQDISQEDGVISKEYNSIYKSKKCTLEVTKEGTTNLNSIIYIDDEVEIKSIEYVDILNWRKEILDRQYAEAIKITLEDTIYIVVIVHCEEPKGRRNYTIDNIPFYGRTGVIKIKNDTVIREVLTF